MASHLLQRAGGRAWTSRSTVLAAITAAHIAIIALLSMARSPPPGVEETQPIAASLFAEQRSEPPPAPLPLPRPPEVVVPQVVPVLVNIDIPPEPVPATITVAATPAPPVRPASTASAPVVNTSEPIMATSVEYVRPPVVSYPSAAKQARATGTAYIRALVETDGRVREVQVQRSSGYASLDKAASESVRGALFKPYTRDGIARAALVDVPVSFALNVRGARRDKGSPPADDCGKPRRQGRDHDEDPCRSGDADRLTQARNQTFVE